MTDLVAGVGCKGQVVSVGCTRSLVAAWTGCRTVPVACKALLVL